MPNAILASILALILMGIACGSAPRQLNLYPSATPNATATREPTQTPRYVQVEVTVRPSVTPSPTPPQPYQATIRGAWFCRADPNIGASVVRNVTDGTIVTVLGRAGAWLQIKTDRAVCFVNAAAIP